MQFTKEGPLLAVEQISGVNLGTRLLLLLVCNPCGTSLKGLVALDNIPVCAESAVLILSEGITFIHYQYFAVVKFFST